MMIIITRAEAARLGLNKYYTGRKCKNGHDCERYVMSCTCVQCARESADKHRDAFIETLISAREDS
ncbi:hypothetical protein PEC302107_36010 [Pectobacterium araliae]|nr:hypothetical protein PEC302107_36010 [Pectobacterium carotovorum subsp. carotovorum]